MLLVGGYSAYRIGFGKPFTLNELANRQAFLYPARDPELFTQVGSSTEPSSTRQERERGRDRSRTLHGHAGPGLCLQGRTTQNPRVRERARAALGPKFNLKDFHAVVLENGAVPLNLLEKLVDEWIATNKT